MTAVVDMVREAIGGRGGERGSAGLDVEQAGRIGLLLMGGLLITRGMVRRTLGGVVLAAAGGELVREGLSGTGPVIRTLGLGTEEEEAAIDLQRSTIVRKSPQECWALWREPSTLKAIMADFADVEATDVHHSHWVLRGSLPVGLQWDAVVTDDRPGEWIAWKSLPGATLPNEGSVSFRDAGGDQGTVVTMKMRFTPPGGPLGVAVARALKALPKGLEVKSLRHFKCLAETGEITIVRGQPACRNDGRDH